MRATTTIIVQQYGNTQMIHFCNTSLQGAVNKQAKPSDTKVIADRYYPIYGNESLFEAVERIMELEGVAHNVTSVEPLGINNGMDYKVVYNVKDTNITCSICKKSMIICYKLCDKCFGGHITYQRVNKCIKQMKRVRNQKDCSFKVWSEAITLLENLLEK